MVIPEDKSIVVFCYDSEQKDQCKFKQKICLDVDDYRKPYSLGYDLEKFYSYIHSSMDNLSNRIVEYANSLGDRQEASKLQYATDYKKL